MTEKSLRPEYRIRLLQRCLSAVGILLIWAGGGADMLGIGTSGFGFGPSQIAVIVVGVSMIIWSIVLGVQPLFKKYVSFIVLAIVLFLVWIFWMFPASLYGLNFMRPQRFALRILILSHLCTLFLCILSIGAAAWTARIELRCPQFKREFIGRHKIFLKRLLFSLLLSVLLIIISGIGVESLSVILVPPWPYRELRPLVYKTDRLNSWGFLDRERTIKKPPKFKRILFVGDSFLESGFYPQSLSDYSYDELSRQGKQNIECVNLGISATEPRDYLYRMRNFGLKLSPDVVFLFIYMGNDLVSVAYEEQSLKLIDERPLPSVLGSTMPRFTWLLVNRFHLSRFDRGVNPIPNEFELLQNICQMPYETGITRLAEHLHQHYFPELPEARIIDILRWGGLPFWQELQPREKDEQYLQGWHVRQIIEHGLRVQQNQPTPPPPKTDIAKITATVSYIQQIAKDLYKKECPFVVFLIPMAEHVDPEYYRFWLPWYQNDEYASWINVQRAGLFTALQEQGITVIDLTEVLRGIQGTYRKFDGHWTAKGHKIVAKHITQTLLRILPSD